ncbi:hypothetical protein CEXT_727621, partial [Caerostris extrusa]
CTGNIQSKLVKLCATFAHIPTKVKKYKTIYQDIYISLLFPENTNE